MRFCVVIPATLLLLLPPGCSGGQVSVMDLPGTLHDGFIIQERYRDLDIAGALDFLKEREEVLYLLLKGAVKKIQYSPSFPARSFPFYDTINLSPFTLERGRAHSVSVILHELAHVLFRGIRAGEGPLEDVMAKFLSMAGVKYADIQGMDKGREEGAAYLIQLSFLKRHGARRDIEYQELRMDAMGYPRYRKGGSHG